MSLTRKMLSAMEIDGEKINQIIEGHSETVTALQGEIDKAKADADKYKAEADRLNGVQKEFDAYKKKVEAEAKEREGKDYDALKKEFDDYKAEQENKALRAKKDSAYIEIMKDAGIPEKHFEKILKYSDVDGVELDENGKITTAKEILKSLKEEWADHIPKTETKGASTATPPGGGRKGMTIEEIDKIEDTAARQQAMLANLDLYGL